MNGEDFPQSELPDVSEPTDDVFVDDNGSPYPAADQVVLRKIWRGIAAEISEELGKS